MKIAQLSPRIFVSGQISVGDIDTLAAQGFKSIINNRPDNEAAGQPRSEELAAKAADLGIGFVHIPVVARSISKADVHELQDACRKLASPILLFCRSGARSATLWQLAGGE
jgi:sulfide:quinone oxidoreductase